MVVRPPQIFLKINLKKCRQILRIEYNKNINTSINECEKEK